MKNFKLLFILLITLAFISSCRKDSMTTETLMKPSTPEINIEATINGFVADRNGDVIPDAIVSILNATTQTDEFGFFEITGLANERHAIVTIEAPGYFIQTKTLIPSKTATSRTRIQLTQKGAPVTLTANQGGQVTISQGSSVEFQPNSFIDQQGNSYSGNVQVYSFFIDPTDENIDQIMPGNLMAINAQNEENVLESYGMVKVLLEGDAGQQLNINKPATMNVAVPLNLLSTAPNEIPLWYFDESNGLWKEEGSAILQNGIYVGEVEHFTFWNCDVPSEVTLIRGQVIDTRGISILKVRITDLSTGASFTSWTDSDGNFTGFVPQNVNLLLEILDVCGTEVLLSENIGPFTEEVAGLGIFNITSNTSFSLITGTLVDCDQAPVSNGKIFFNLPVHSFYQQTNTDASGNFSALVPTCDLTEIEISGVDLNSSLVSDIQVLAVSPEIDAGVISTCINVSGTLGSVEININGLPDPKLFDNCTVDIQDLSAGTGYVFNYYEDLGTDTITYIISVSDLNDDINNPNWGAPFFGFSPPPNGTPLTYNRYTTSFFGVQPITLDQPASNPGELLGITIYNCSINVREIVDGTQASYNSYPNSSISLTAVVQ